MVLNVYNPIYRMGINYRRISLRHNLSRKCRKIVKFVSITHSEHNIWNGPTVTTATRGKSVNQCWRKMAASPTERSGCALEFSRCKRFVAVQRAFRRKFGRRGHYMKLQTFIFQIVVISCISVQYLWKYCFAITPIIYTHPVLCTHVPYVSWTSTNMSEKTTVVSRLIH
jgi:hypothetical protein